MNPTVPAALRQHQRSRSNAGVGAQFEGYERGDRAGVPCAKLATDVHL
jgi:hypothetical protein